MDLAYLLIADAIGLMVATFVLTYFFIKDFLKDKNKK
jgi:hypothetical protein